jgi:hypothetical protein
MMLYSTITLVKSLCMLHSCTTKQNCLEFSVQQVGQSASKKCLSTSRRPGRTQQRLTKYILDVCQGNLKCEHYSKLSYSWGLLKITLHLTKVRYRRNFTHLRQEVTRETTVTNPKLPVVGLHHIRGTLVIRGPGSRSRPLPYIGGLLYICILMWMQYIY